MLGQEHLTRLMSDPCSFSAEELIAALRDKNCRPEFRWYIIKALGSAHPIEGIKPLLDVLMASDVVFADSSLHRIAAWALGRAGTRALDGVRDLSKSSFSYQRLAAADALGEIGDPAGVDELWRLLLDSNKEVKLWAALGLAKVGPSSLPFLAKALNENDDTALLAFDAIVTMAHPDGVPAAVSFYHRQPDQVRIYLKAVPRAKLEPFRRCLEDELKKNGSEDVQHLLHILKRNSVEQ